MKKREKYSLLFLSSFFDFSQISTLFFSLISMVVINIPKYAIDYLSSESVQAIYGIISMPATFVMLLGQFILQPSLVSMAIAYRNQEKLRFNRIVLKMSIIVFATLILLIPIAYLLGIPVLNLIYGLDLSPYKFSLILYFLYLQQLLKSFHQLSQILIPFSQRLENGKKKLQNSRRKKKRKKRMKNQ